MNEIVKFKGKNVSWVKNLNLLNKERNIYIMDNHVAAVWCWLQEIELNKKYNILHVDAHYDTMSSRLDTWLEYLPNNLKELDITELLALKFYDRDFIDGYEIMRWDNYFPIFHRLYGKNINSYHFFTHKGGTLFGEMEDKLDEHPIPGLFNLIDYLFEERTSGPYEWIVNIDLDYFFQKIDDTDITLKFISDEAIDFFLEKLNTYLANNKIKVVTIALSPECCGGWENSLGLMKFFAERLRIEFNL
ncbi:UPF0489 family protein [uncultured Draconibacterium sp.]|uniref:UPF0489 family protein n=1 Tax=uncultured Draconibacterium sp. TaxID=1573823 RepID=UPI0025D5ED76|nr:UPF0489 family protein [uncultured Draconibacterium sp.]